MSMDQRANLLAYMDSKSNEMIDDEDVFCDDCNAIMKKVPHKDDEIYFSPDKWCIQKFICTSCPATMFRMRQK